MNSLSQIWFSCDCQPKHHLILNSFTYAHRLEEFSSKCHCLHFWETALTIETKIKMVWIRYVGSRSTFKVKIKLKEKGVSFIFLLYFLCNNCFYYFKPCSKETCISFSMAVLYIYHNWADNIFSAMSDRIIIYGAKFSLNF